jgi:predicted PurR-regulated permease PerM
MTGRPVIQEVLNVLPWTLELTFLSLIIGVSAGLVLWIYGVTGLFPQGATYAALFAAWVFVMEFIPYIGPILGAVPPLLLALFTSPITALWVLIAFVVIHQFEGHVVVPQIMGDAVGVHPLVVIFGILIGEELDGLPGIILAIPVVVLLKETVVYASERMGWFNMSLPPDDPLIVARDDQITSSGFTPPPRRATQQQPDGDTLDVPTSVIEATRPSGAE